MHICIKAPHFFPNIKKKDGLMHYVGAFMMGGRCACGPVSGMIERPHAASARCQFEDILMQDALLCERLPVALCNTAIHPPSALSAPIHPLPSFLETSDC